MSESTKDQKPSSHSAASGQSHLFGVKSWRRRATDMLSKARRHRVIQLLASRSFRMVLIYVVTLGLSVSLLLSALFGAMRYNIEQRHATEVQRLVTELERFARRMTPSQYADVINATSRRVAPDGVLLVLVNPFGRQIAGTEGFTYQISKNRKRFKIVFAPRTSEQTREGAKHNLEAVPLIPWWQSQDRYKWFHKFHDDDDDDDDDHDHDHQSPWSWQKDSAKQKPDSFMFKKRRQYWEHGPFEYLIFEAQAIRMPLHGTLLIAQSDAVERIMNFAFKSVLIVILVLTLLIGTIGGIILSRRILRQVNAINQTVDAVLEGNLLGRVPTTGTGDEFDRLSSHLNTMLDKITSLIDDIRAVTDNIAHDLRTPLTRLRTTLSALGDQAGSDAALLHQATAEADNLITIFNALLRISELERGQRDLAMAAHNMTPALRDLAELYTPLLDDRGQTITLDCPEDFTFRCERQLVIQAISNVLENSIKYAETGARLMVKATRSVAENDKTPAQRDEGNVLIEIFDTGPGVTPDEYAHLTNRFQRGDKARTSTGYGLGLALVQAIVSRHGGTLSISAARPYAPELFDLDSSQDGLRVALLFPET